MIMEKELERITEQKLAALRKSSDDSYTDQNNVNSKKVSKRALLARLLPALIAGGCVVSGQSALKPSIPKILPDVYASTPLQLPASYIIYKSGSKYYALNCATDNLDYSNVDADVVINDAITALTGGGLIHLAGGTTFTTYASINITGSPRFGYPMIIIEGEGNSATGSVIIPNSTGFDTMVVSNSARICLRDLWITASTANRAFYGSSAGANNNFSMVYSQMHNVTFASPTNVVGTQDVVARFIGPFQSWFGNIAVLGCPTKAVMSIENTSTGLNEGNNFWSGLYLTGGAYSAPGIPNLLIASPSTAIMNLNHISYVQSVPNTTPINPNFVGIQLNNVRDNWIYGFDLEGHATSIKLTGTSSSMTCQDNHFIGGYATAAGGNPSNNISCDQYSTANTFKSLALGIANATTGNVISDANSQAAPNVYEDIHMIATSTYNPVSVTGSTYPIFRGVGGTPGSGLFFTNQGTSIQNGTGQKVAFTIPHLINGTPRFFSVTPGFAYTGNYYVTADSANITATFSSAPPPGKNAVILYWVANL